MSKDAVFDKIDLSLIRVLHTVITECSVSKAALRLQSSQPAVSTQLKRLREITGDPLLVRCGQAMAPTDVALSLLEPAIIVVMGGVVAMIVLSILLPILQINTLAMG